MNCKQIETVLADYLGGELADDVSRQFDAHLKTCDPCSREIDELRATVQSLSELDTVTLAEARRRTRDLHVTHRVPLTKRLIFTLLRTAAVLAIGVFLGRLSVSHDTNSLGALSPDETAVLQRAQPVIHPEWIALAQEHGRHTSGFASSLRALAQSLHSK